MTIKPDIDVRGSEAAPAFHVEIIDTYAAFEAARPAWQRLMEKDPEATVFLGWEWLAQAFRDNPMKWSVIAVRSAPNAPDFICLLPLKYRVRWSQSQSQFQTEIEAGGRLLWSEYTGFLCDPLYEAPALAAAAQALARLPWSRLSMRYIAQGARAKGFASAFAKRDFEVEWKDYLINKGAIDNLVCPYVQLPQDFEGYLQEQVSANMRQKHHRFLRRMEREGFRFSLADSETFARDVDILLGFWRQKWSVSKGKAKADAVASNYFQVLSAAQATGSLYLPVLWRQDVPIGALGHIVDQGRERMHFIVSGRDADTKDPFIGSALHFHSIQSAIDQGYESYDFCHGNERYKYSFGVSEQRADYFTIRRRTAAEGERFDSISTGEALQKTIEFLEGGRVDKALDACKQMAKLLG